MKKTPLKKEIVGMGLQRNTSTRKGSGAAQPSTGKARKPVKETVVSSKSLQIKDSYGNKPIISAQGKGPSTSKTSAGTTVKDVRKAGKDARKSMKKDAKAIKQAPRKAKKLERVTKRQEKKTERVEKRTDVAGKLRRKTEKKENRIDKRADNKLKRQETATANTAKRQANKIKRKENKVDNKLNRQNKKIAKAQGKIDKIKSPRTAAGKAESISKGVEKSGGSASGGRGGASMSPFNMKTPMNMKSPMNMETPMKKALVGDQANLNDGLKSAISAAPKMRGPVKYVQNASGVVPSQTNPFGEVNQMNTNFNPQAQQVAQQMQAAKTSPMMLNYKKKK